MNFYSYLISLLNPLSSVMSEESEAVRIAIRKMLAALNRFEFPEPLFQQVRAIFEHMGGSLTVAMCIAIAKSVEAIDDDSRDYRNPFQRTIAGILNLYGGITLGHIALARLAMLELFVESERPTNTGSDGVAGDEEHVIVEPRNQILELVINLIEEFLVRREAYTAAINRGDLNDASIDFIAESNRMAAAIADRVQQLYVDQETNALVQRIAAQWAATPDNFDLMVAAASYIPFTSRR